MNTLYKNVTQSFSEFFDRDADAVFQAPGRVNLIGEHTDYNNGFVLPCAINRGTYMAIGRRTDNRINVVAMDNNNKTSQWQSVLPINMDVDQPWATYLRGVNEQFLKKNMKPAGMDITVTGNIPLGAGLSSSAAFCVVLATAVNTLNGFALSPSEIALLCQAAENEFVGCKCGIMDQLVSVAGQRGHALLIDCKDLGYTPIPVPDDMQITIIDSKVTRGLVGSKYNERRRQCEEAAHIMQVDSLREADYASLLQYEQQMDATVFRRARHIVTENVRTEKAAVALQNADYQTLSRLMAESHASMRDDFAITCMEVDYLVEIVSETLQDKGGVRMTGGGFGGCVVALAPVESSQAIIDTVNNLYCTHTSLQAQIHLCSASNGAGMVCDTSFTESAEKTAVYNDRQVTRQIKSSNR
jgi:galactokinase